MKRSEFLLFVVFASFVLIFFSSSAFADFLDEDDNVQPVPKNENVPTDPTPASPTPADKLKTQKLNQAQPKTEQGRDKIKNSATSSGSQTILEPKSKAKRETKQNSAVEDSKQPVQFESKGLQALKEKGTAELIDDVVVTQGTMRMEADKAKIYYDDNVKDVVRVVAEGNVKIFKIDEETGEKIKAFGDRVEFDNKLRTVVLDGNPRLWRGADLVRGKKIIYELDTGWIRADRVAGEVHPQEDKKK